MIVDTNEYRYGVAMTVNTPPRDPLGPIDTTVSFLLLVLGLLAVAILATTVYGSGSLTYYGSNEACTVLDAGLVPGGISSTGEAEFDGPVLAPESRSHADSIALCDTAAGPWLHALAVASTTSGMALLLVSLGLIKNIVRHSRREGLFTTGTARRTGQLGWALVVVSLGLELLRQVSNHAILSGVAPGNAPGFWSVLTHGDLPVQEILVGTGMIAVSRVLRHAVVLQRYEDTTI